MRFSTPLISVAALAPLAASWTGSDTFSPKRNAEVVLLGDATTSNNYLSYALHPLRANVPDLFGAYEAAGFTLKVGYHITGAQDGKCWRNKLDLTGSVTDVREALQGAVMDKNEVEMIPAFWNMILKVASEFSSDPSIRKVIMLMSEKTPHWTSRGGVWPLTCKDTAPTPAEFGEIMERYNVGLVYSAEHFYPGVTETAAAVINAMLEETKMSDFHVVSQSSYPESGDSGKSIVPALAEMLSEDRTTTTTTTKATGTWTGSATFSPKRNAEVIILADATTSAHALTYALGPVHADIPDLFNAYKRAGLTIRVAFHKTGAQDGKCWRPELDLTHYVSAVLGAVQGGVMDKNEVNMIPAFWNMILKVAADFSTDSAIRKVIVLMSEKTPEWGTRGPVSPLTCNDTAPTPAEFGNTLGRYGIGFVYSAEHRYVSVTEQAAAKITTMLQQTPLTDYKVVSQKSYPESGPSGKSIIPALAEMLSQP